MSPFSHATTEDCADYTITIFSDRTRRVTMQNLFNNGSFSCSGISEEIISLLAQEYIILLISKEPFED